MIKTAKELNCILLVDDDEITNSIHKMVIEELGVSKKIEIADSANKALELLENLKINAGKAPDIIFLDLNMPGMNGWDFLELYNDRKKNNGNNGHDKSVIIVLSNTSNPNDIKRAKAFEDVAGFRSKPLTDLMLHEIMDHYFEA